MQVSPQQGCNDNAFAGPPDDRVGTGRAGTLSPMPDVLLLLPDFLLILCGFVLCRYTALNRPVWEAAERLVYYLLFPVLLFNSIVRTPLQPSTTAHLALAGVL
eukprot:Opistho-2@37180